MSGVWATIWADWNIVDLAVVNWIKLNLVSGSIGGGSDKSLWGLVWPAAPPESGQGGAWQQG